MRNDKRRARVRHLSRLLGAGLVVLAGPARAAGPSFDCAKVAPGSVEALVCQDAALAAADRKLAQVFAQAQASAGNVHPPMLRAEQRGWIKGRDECWKSEDRPPPTPGTKAPTSCCGSIRARPRSAGVPAARSCGARCGTPMSINFELANQPSDLSRHEPVAMRSSQPAQCPMPSGPRSTGREGLLAVREIQEVAHEKSLARCARKLLDTYHVMVDGLYVFWRFPPRHSDLRRFLP